MVGESWPLNAMDARGIISQKLNRLMKYAANRVIVHYIRLLCRFRTKL